MCGANVVPEGHQELKKERQMAPLNAGERSKGTVGLLRSVYLQHRVDKSFSLLFLQHDNYIY